VIFSSGTSIAVPEMGTYFSNEISTFLEQTRRQAALSVFEANWRNIRFGDKLRVMK